MPGRDLSAELYGDSAPVAGGRDLSEELYGKPESNAIASFGAGLGKGFGSTVLGAQHYVGKGLSAIGLDKAGQWLQDDAASGRKRLADELAPYKAGSPIAGGAGEFGGEIAATLPVGGVLARGAAAVGAPALAASLATGGMRAGGMAGARGMAIRAAGGAVNGGVSAGLVDPENVASGAVLGAALPGVVKVMGAAGSATRDATSRGAKYLMQSALKPTIAQLRSGEAATAVDTLLKYGINPTKAGVGQLRGMIDDLNGQIKDKIANSTARVDKQKVLAGLDDVRTKFGNQVSPTADLGTIQSAADDFLAHPNYPGATLPVQAAQDLKQGTYRVLSKKYGQMGNADVEAQKALARGLKNEIANAVPGVAGLNAEESKLLSTLSVTERRALMDMNKNPMGLATLAQSPASWAMFMADKSALFKSLSARMLNASGVAAATNAPRLEGRLSNPLLRNAALLPAIRGRDE